MKRTGSGCAQPASRWRGWTTTATLDDSDDAIKSVRAFYEARTRRLEATGPNGQKSAVADETKKYIARRLTVLRVERSGVFDQRRDGCVNATLLRTIERDVDLEESRLGDF